MFCVWLGWGGEWDVGIFKRSENHRPSDVDIREGKPWVLIPVLLPVTTFPEFFLKVIFWEFMCCLNYLELITVFWMYNSYLSLFDTQYYVSVVCTTSDSNCIRWKWSPQVVSHHTKLMPFCWLCSPCCTSHPHDLFCNSKFVPLKLWFVGTEWMKLHRGTFAGCWEKPHKYSSRMHTWSQLMILQRTDLQ